MSECLSAKKQLLNGCTYQKMLVQKFVTFLKKNKNGHFIFGFFGSDPFKMDQTRKFGEQTSRILEFKPEGWYLIN